MKLSVSDVAIEEISVSVNLGDDELGGPSDGRLSTQLAIRSFLSNRLGQFIDKAVSTSAVPGAIIQLNSNGQINSELIPATRSFLNSNGQGYLSRLEVVEDIPALDLSAGDIGTEEYEQQELELSGTISWSDGDTITQSGRPFAIGYAKGDGSTTNILIVASIGGEWIAGDDSVGSEWFAGSGYNIFINGVDSGVHVNALGGSSAQTDNFFLRSSNSSQYLVLDVPSTPSVTNDTLTNVERTSDVSTYTTTNAHNFNAGGSVRVICNDPTYTVSSRIIATPTTTTFTVANEGADESSKAATGSVQTTLTSADSNSQGAVTDLRMGVCLNVDNTNITSGSGYSPALATEIYNSVSLTNVSGSGTGAKANITVTSGAVTDVDLVRGGTGYAIGDVLSAADGDIGGGGGAGFEIEILSIEDRLYVDLLGGELFVASASSVDYAEDNSAVANKQTITLTDTIDHLFLAGTIGGGGQVNYTDSRITIVNHGLTDGDPVSYTTEGNVAIGGLLNDQVYYVKRIDSDIIELYVDYALITQRTFTSTPANNNHRLIRYTVNITDNSVVAPAHGFAAGDAIRLEGSDLPQINAEDTDTGVRFFVGSVTTNSFTLHSLRSDATVSINGLVTQAKDLTDVGTGTVDIIPNNLRINDVVNTSSRIKDNWSSLAVTNIDAENIVSGTISPTRLASSGVANTETFLRGDSTYAVAVQHLLKANTVDNPITLTGLNIGGEFYEDVSVGIANVDLDAGATFSSLGVSRFLQSQFDVNADASGEVFIKDGVIDAGTLDGLDSSYFLNPANLTSSVPVTRGGTGLSNYATGDMIFASSPGTITTLPLGIPGAFLSVNEDGNAPEWNTNIFIEEGLDLGSASITSDSTGNGQLYPANITSLYVGLDAENVKIGKRTTERDITNFVQSFEANTTTSVVVNLLQSTKSTASDTVNDSNYIELSNTTGLIPGMVVTGTSIAANTSISGISGDYIFVSNNTTGTITSGDTLTFSYTPQVLGIEAGDSVTINNSVVTNLDGTWFISGATFNATSFTVKVDNNVTTLSSTALAVGLSVVRDNTMVMKNENIIFGSAEASSTPFNANLKGESGIGSNIEGGDIILTSGLGTGNAAGGEFIVKTGEALATPSSLQHTPTTRLTITNTGISTFTNTVYAKNLFPTDGDNQGVVGDGGNTWSNGNFTNFAVNSVLTVRGAIDLADSDQLRLGSSDDIKLYYDGTGNVFNIELESAATKLSVTDNGTERFSIAKATGNTSVGGNLTVVGDLEVQGTETVLNTATLAVEDKNIEIAKVTTPTDTTADGAGITIKGATDKTITWSNNAGYFNINQSWNLTSGLEYYINDISVLSATTLGANIVNSSLTSVGTIGSGTWQGSIISPTYGGTGINNGTKTITLGGNFTHSGAHTLSLTTTGNTALTLPTSGTVANRGNLSQFAATTSLQLKGVISDETGGGALVFAESPTFVTDVDSADSTFEVFNTPATIVAFSAGTDIEIGATTGTTTVKNNLVADSISLQGADFNDGNITNVGSIGLDTIVADALTNGFGSINFAASTQVNIDNVTNATSTTTGALIVDGGAGFAKDVWAANFYGNGSTLSNVDNYGSWTLKEGNGEETSTVGSGQTAHFEQGTGMQVELTAARQLTFTNTDRGSSQNIFKSVLAEQSDGTDIGTVVADTNSDTLTIRENGGMSLGVDATNDIITIGHADTSSQTSLAVDNTNGTVIQDLSVTIDTYGHVTGLSQTSVNLDTRYVLETGDTMTGMLTVDMNNSNEKIRMQGDANDSPFISFYQDNRAGFIQYNHSQQSMRIVNDISDEELRITSGDNGLQFINGGTAYTVYHTGNSSTLATVAGTVTRDEYRNFGTVAFTNSSNTANFIAELESKGFFDYRHAVCKNSWSYAGNSDISDTGFGTFELAGCVIETWTDNSSDTVRGNVTVRVTRPNTGGDGSSVLVYNDQGPSYSPGWREMVSTRSSVTNITGEIRATGEITAYYSDERLKTFTGKIGNALDKVKALNGYLYVENDHAKELGFDNNISQVGVSAQEVKDVLPEAVSIAPFDMNAQGDSKSGEDYLTVKYERMVPLLIEAIKEQQSEIDELKAMVKKLLDK